MWLDFTLYRAYGEAQQLRTGLLQTLHFDHIVGASPSVIRCLLVPGSGIRLTAAGLQDTMKIQYSPPGSNWRQMEETVILNWFNFLQECVFYLINNILEVTKLHVLNFTDSSESLGVNLGDVLAFMTGLRNIPPMGFDKPITVEFFAGERLPNASTCSLVIRLPRLLTDSNAFTIVFSILGTCGFGNV